MGDILIHLASKMLRLLSLWSCGDRGSDLPQIPRPAGLSAQRSRAEPAPLRVDVAQFDLGITHQPVAALGLEDADRLADQRLADKDQLARPFDLAVAAHAAHRNLIAIVRILDPMRIGSWRRRVQRGRRLLSQRLVRPLIVVDRAERVEPLSCCAGKLAAGGVAVSWLRVRCTRSCRPFCCGLPATIRSGRMPSLIHHTASRDSPPTPADAKGGPLSERIASGKPCSLKAAAKIGRTFSSSGRATA